MKRILIACEESQTVCAAFRKLGHEAYSCDILDPSGGYPEWHIKSDGDTHTKDIVYGGKWDMMIAHPPCTCLTSAGQWYYSKYPDLVDEAAIFFMMFANAPIPKIAIENPAGVMSRRWRKADQYVHPYYFGDPNMKRTGLWLKGLDKLKHPDPKKLDKPQPTYIDYTGKKRYFTDAISGDKNGGHHRSKTFQVIADAMATQWGSLLTN